MTVSTRGLNVNRNQNGYVDFEKFQGLDGIALVNVVATGRKTPQSLITHNAGEYALGLYSCALS